MDPTQRAVFKKADLQFRLLEHFIIEKDFLSIGKSMKRRIGNIAKAINRSSYDVEKIAHSIVRRKLKKDFPHFEKQGLPVQFITDTKHGEVSRDILKYLLRNEKISLNPEKVREIRSIAKKLQVEPSAVIDILKPIVIELANEMFSESERKVEA